MAAGGRPPLLCALVRQRSKDCDDRRTRIFDVGDLVIHPRLGSCRVTDIDKSRDPWVYVVWAQVAGGAEARAHELLRPGERQQPPAMPPRQDVPVFPQQDPPPFVQFQQQELQRQCRFSWERLFEHIGFRPEKYHDASGQRLPLQGPPLRVRPEDYGTFRHAAGDLRRSAFIESPQALWDRSRNRDEAARMLIEVLEGHRGGDLLCLTERDINHILVNVAACCQPEPAGPAGAAGASAGLAQDRIAAIFAALERSPADGPEVLALRDLASENQANRDAIRAAGGVALLCREAEQGGHWRIRMYANEALGVIFEHQPAGRAGGAGGAGWVSLLGEVDLGGGADVRGLYAAKLHLAGIESPQALWDRARSRDDAGRMVYEAGIVDFTQVNQILDKCQEQQQRGSWVALLERVGLGGARLGYAARLAGAGLASPEALAARARNRDEAARAIYEAGIADFGHVTLIAEACVRGQRPDRDRPRRQPRDHQQQRQPRDQQQQRQPRDQQQQRQPRDQQQQRQPRDQQQRRQPRDQQQQRQPRDQQQQRQPRDQQQQRQPRDQQQRRQPRDQQQRRQPRDQQPRRQPRDQQQQRQPRDQQPRRQPRDQQPRRPPYQQQRRQPRGPGGGGA